MRLIDANALINYANSMKNRTVDANDIARFPTAYTLKHGVFVYDPQMQEYFCSICGHFTASELDMESECFESEFGKGFRLVTPRYCKHCGTKMDGAK